MWVWIADWFLYLRAMLKSASVLGAKMLKDAVDWAEARSLHAGPQGWKETLDRESIDGLTARRPQSHSSS